MATVDVIIPAYNAAHFLPKALDSVIAQTFSDWRIILVDDGSTDATGDVIAPYQSSLGKQFFYVKTKNAGVSAARNVGVEHATAVFLALLDADDVWLPRRLEAALDVFALNPTLGLVYGFVTRIDMHGRQLDTFATPHPNGEGMVARHLYTRSLDIPCSTVTCKRSAVLEVGGFDETMRATEDRDLWLRIAQRYEVAHVHEVVTYYRVSPQNATSDPDRMLKAQMYFFSKHRGTTGCGPKEYRAAMSSSYQQRAESLSDSGSRLVAVSSALKSLTLRPLSKSVWKMSIAVTLRALGLRPNKRIDPTR